MPVWGGVCAAEALVPSKEHSLQSWNCDPAEAAGESWQRTSAKHHIPTATGTGTSHPAGLLPASWSHGIVERFGLEGTLKTTQTHPLPGQGQFPLFQKLLQHLW